ncbi:phosphotransferase family protein [Actinopolymorpha alba]|uniref:phosphotransferase family protein n=1 Tax=Actinopolymorpha alba TaxID=533267 RepID=UPI00037319F4|nr:phosphotransferase [Actinopolymorpha alba]
MSLDLNALLEAVAAEDQKVDLSGVVLHSGWESVVLETRDGWILRFPRAHVDFEREVAVLRRLAGRLPVPIPTIEWTGRHRPFAAYRKIDGWEFDRDAYARAPEPQRDALAGSLAAFLAAMHTILTPAEITELAIPVPDDLGSAIARLAGTLDVLPPNIRDALADVLDEARALSAGYDGAEDPVLLHNDFHFGNLVLDGPVGELAGIWDFSCVQLGDPSSDLRYLATVSADLLRRVAGEYERLTGRRVDARAAIVAARLEIASDAMDLNEPETLEKAVRKWRHRDAMSS